MKTAFPLLFAAILLLSLACATDPTQVARPTATSEGTIEQGLPATGQHETTAAPPTTRLPIQTLTPRQIESTREAQVAEIKTRHAPTPTHRPTRSFTVPTRPLLPTPVAIPTVAIPTPPGPVIVATVAPPPTPWIPVLPTLPPPVLPTLSFSFPTPEVPTKPAAPQPQWEVNNESGEPVALLLTPPDIVPVRAIIVACATNEEGDRWLAPRIVGEELFLPDIPQYSKVTLSYTIDGEQHASDWLPGLETWEGPDEGFQRLYPSKTVGKQITDALLGGARVIEMSIGDIEYLFETHGFPQAAKPLIDFCQSSQTLAPPPTLLPTPSFTEITAELADFAAACADIRNRDESAPDWTFEGWVAEAQAVEVPLELADWWSAYVDQFALQLVYDGPSQHSQKAADTAMDELVFMDFRIREYLVDAGCITGTEVWQADTAFAAWGRLVDGFGQGDDVTIEEFAEACRDIKLTAPTLDRLIAIPEHMAYWWDKLNPPSELSDYYAAVAVFYDEWIETGGGDPQTDVSFETQMALIETAQALDQNVLETLLARRCAG